MIRFLGIRDLAIVDTLECEFDAGFNVLTGETGAGKSIIVGALGLLLGERSSGNTVRTGAECAVVQAAFETGLGEEKIVRREVPASGRGRIFIDDALSSAATLKKLGTGLVDIHGQHAHQALLDPRNHLRLLDTYGTRRTGVDPTGAVKTRYEQWRDARALLAEAEQRGHDRAEKVDVLKFALAEIDRVAPRPGEDGQLLIERNRLANAEKLQALAGGAYAALYEKDDSVISLLAAIWRQVEELARLDPSFAPYLETRGTVDSTLDELARTLRSCAADIETTPDRLAHVESRLAEIERLARKYGGHLDTILERRQTIVAELDRAADETARHTDLVAALEAARDAYLAAAGELSASRVHWASALAPALETESKDLAIANGRFEVRLESGLPETRWSARGTDEAELFFSANPGEDLQPLSKVASGGELSRVMLALKTLAATDDAGKTLVFDEVDAGIGGDAAYRVGERLRALGKRFQVLCVTHAPQLAAHATTHFQVTKEVAGGRTRARIERLPEDRRAAELSRLMTGRAGGAALAGAEELLARAATGAKGERESRGERRKPASAG
ncbi:MAG: DNA repair protein RecN [Acidobacteria bacterium]|nr:DNA repair protein RecN [Acidobacteriota bacterium]MYJ03772.1 DNA repair protein RecN [Acidobacteriota bacterium]